MDYLHTRGLDRLLKDINHYPEGTINVNMEAQIKKATDMANKATAAAKEVIEANTGNTLKRGIAIKASAPLFETAMEAIVILKRTGIPIADAKAAVLLALAATSAMIESTELTEPE